MKANKSNLASGYRDFLSTEAGKDLLAKFETLTTDFTVQAMRQTDPNIKARYIDQLGGALLIRDYIVRISTGEANPKKGQKKIANSAGGGSTPVPLSVDKNK